MSEVASSLGIGPVFSYKGKEYRISQRDFEIEALAERKVCENALNAIKRFRDSLTPAEYQMQMDGWRRDLASQVYSFGSPAFLSWAFSTEGMKYLAYLQLVKLNREVTLRMVDDIWQDEKAWEELNLKMAEANTDPTKAQTSV